MTRAILGRNIARRHLSTGARAIIAEQARRLTGGGYGSQGETARSGGLATQRLRDAALVLDWAPDEAERALGRMLLAARDAGDLASSGQYSQGVEAIDTLADFGIGRDLASHAVLLADVPDDVWADWHTDDAGG